MHHVSPALLMYRPILPKDNSPELPSMSDDNIFASDLIDNIFGDLELSNLVEIDQVSISLFTKYKSPTSI